MDIICKYGIIASLTIAYLITLYVVRVKKEFLNAVSWVFWLIIDLVALYGLWKKGEDLTLVLTFVIGTGAVTLVLLWKKMWEFGRTELWMLLLVITCLIVVMFGTPDMVVWASAIGLSVAGISFLKDLSGPNISGTTKWMCAFYFLAMIFSVARTAYLDQSFILPISCLFYWIIALNLAFKEHVHFFPKY